jgi:hypothetical protein
MGAYELSPALALHGVGRDGYIQLNWSVSASLPGGSDWKISYVGPPGNPVSPILHIAAATRSYTITGLTNQTWYTVTLNAMLADTPILTDIVQLMPTSEILYLPAIVTNP